jgi:arylsulfatase A-like enzyme
MTSTPVELVRRGVLVLAGTALVAAGVACGDARGSSKEETAAAALPSKVAAHRAVTGHVVVISVDGLRPDAIDAFAAPTLQRLEREGSATLRAQTVRPSITLPSHVSMLTGVLPERHGVLWNTDETPRRGPVAVPTVFSIAHRQGLTTAAFFSKSKFHHLQQPGALDYVRVPSGSSESWPASRTAGDVERYLQEARPNLLFVHLADPDNAGHDQGWMTPAYGDAVARADSAVARVLAAAGRAYGEGNFTVILTADHGGHGRGHSDPDPLDMTIPWIAWGEGVEPGTLPAGIRTVDTAATVLWLLGLAVPGDWTGTPVTVAFEGRQPATNAAGR